MQTIARCWEENQSLLCPHTAVAVSYHYQQMLRQTPRYGRGHLGHWARMGAGGWLSGTLFFPKQGTQECEQMA